MTKRFKAIKVWGKNPNEVAIKDIVNDVYITTEDDVLALLNHLNDENEQLVSEPCDMEEMAVIKLTNILSDLALIKKYAIEKKDEKIYLCADNIERDLHKVVYGNAKLEKGWF